MQSGIIDPQSRITSATFHLSSRPQSGARHSRTAFADTRTFGKRLGTTLVTIALLTTLSGCGVFCAGAGASGGGFAGGCGTRVRF
jgi:multisubunit Na+/H+ antiporter MnhB subunit